MATCHYCNYFSLLIFMEVLVMMAFSMDPSDADPRTDFVLRICGTVNVENVSNYFMYYSSITDYMQEEMHRNKFAFKDAGKAPDRLYVLAQCMDDLSNDECGMCYTEISSLIPTCFPHTGGRVYLDGCFIRVENYSFYRQALDPLDTKRCGDKINKSKAFEVAVNELIRKMLLNAPNSQGFDVNQETSNGTSAYGMASCWKILDPDLCSMCLSQAATSAVSCLPSAQAHGLNAGCFLRYADMSFANNPGGASSEEMFHIAIITGLLAICVLAIGIGIYVGKLTYRSKIRLEQSKDHNTRTWFDSSVAASLAQTASWSTSTLQTEAWISCYLQDPAKKKELDWKKRFLIIKGTAEGLEYLHNDCQVRIIHRDIKASNVLLDLRHRPKISDFGLARFYSCDQSLTNTAIAGTLGYMAPEYIARGRLTEKVDVYSFGVLVIEIITGVKNNKYQSEKTYETIVAWAWKHFQSNTVQEIIDKSMKIEDVEEIQRVVRIGLLCTQESPNLRPTMTEVVQMLRKKDVQLPSPSKPPFTDEHMELHYSGLVDRQPSTFDL